MPSLSFKFILSLSINFAGRSSLWSVYLAIGKGAPQEFHPGNPTVPYEVASLCILIKISKTAFMTIFFKPIYFFFIIWHHFLN